ncbi:PAS domain-containing sensor histidine kinase [Devosia sp. SL43]|uniref:PAS domain-containing sensor histidine kinase n=1 Tax=Devosia sp. SL43 TaxID=2806348 RepID=UPI001F19D8F6|nr:PAS domain-containing sensor histidine kinase [Devosia sp. SL43]UJW85498.1 PAS domain-containing sensor histidine kinase [Devosia sp. SL43]
MRSLFSFGASKEMSLAIAGTGHRPEMLRRKTLANNSRIAIIVSALMMPLAVYWLVTAAILPIVLAAIGLGSGMVTLALHQRQRFEDAAAGQVYTMLALGLLLTLADSQFGDAGLAIALMAPVLASLLGRQTLRRQSWMMLVGVLALGTLASTFVVPTIPLPSHILLATAGVTFIASVGVVIHTANRINAAYEVYDKAQVTAYRHLIEHVQDAVIRFSSDGEVLLASRSSETLFGCRRYELTGSGLGERLHVLDRPIYLTAFADANQGGKSRVIEVRMRQDDPRSASSVPHFIWVEISLSPVIDADPSTIRYEVVALLRDITDRKDNEVAMAEARRVAEEASIAKSRFLATIGHELRTPLNAVVGFSEMMTSGIGGELSTTHREYAGLIHQSGKHLLEVVRMLLDMSKIEAGKFELQTEPFLVQDIIEPCFHMVESLAKERGVHLVPEIGKALPMLIGDERACRQVLLNLLSNAIKFSHPGGTVTVTLKRQGQSVNLSVSDRGVGMAPESLKRIGEPFFQAEDGLARRYEGTGLGLSIVKGLVDLHDGTLRAMSEIGAGTTMTVLLPINGPAIKTDETATVTPLRREPAAAPDTPWQVEKRKAQ